MPLDPPLMTAWPAREPRAGDARNRAVPQQTTARLRSVRAPPTASSGEEPGPQPASAARHGRLAHGVDDTPALGDRSPSAPGRGLGKPAARAPARPGRPAPTVGRDDAVEEPVAVRRGDHAVDDDGPVHASAGCTRPPRPRCRRRRPCRAPRCRRPSATRRGRPQRSRRPPRRRARSQPPPAPPPSG